MVNHGRRRARRQAARLRARNLLISGVQAFCLCGKLVRRGRRHCAVRRLLRAAALP